MDRVVQAAGWSSIDQKCRSTQVGSSVSATCRVPLIFALLISETVSMLREALVPLVTARGVFCSNGSADTSQPNEVRGDESGLGGRVDVVFRY